MREKEIVIGLETGLEARPVALLVQVASQFESDIYIESGNKKVNAKSIMGMMSLGLDNGETVKVITNGSDENTAMEGIEKFLKAE
ncbi:MAG: HPr family phosphocarrier protein [Lachnospiraceae bacterium]|nr:HPr family phosphocarrier protein [Lachnospiraceae bacterium]